MLQGSHRRRTDNHFLSQQSPGEADDQAWVDAVSEWPED